MKKIKLIFLSCVLSFLFAGCVVDIENERSIVVTCEPSTATIKIDNQGAIQSFNYTFTLKSDSKQVYLKGMNITYYSDTSVITTRKYTGNYVCLRGKDDVQNYPLNLVIPEVYGVLDANKIIRASILFRFESVSGVMVDIPSEVTIVKLETTSSSAISY